MQESKPVSEKSEEVQISLLLVPKSHYYVKNSNRVTGSNLCKDKEISELLKRMMQLPVVNRPNPAIS